ncbi:MAG: hypothetical protein MR378_04740 [Ruminococcus sp.]|nr:hypothetical protein [Ruminococcus sp.]
MANQKFSVEEILKEYQSDEATKGKKESPSGKLETQKMLNHAAGRRNVPPSTEASAEAYSYASSRTRQRTPYSPYRSEMAANINQIKQNRYQRRTDVEESRTAAFQTLELMRPKVSFVRSPAIRPQTTPNPKSDHISDYDGAVLLEQPESEQKPEQPVYQPAIQEMQDSTRAKEKKQAQKSRKPKKRTEQSYQRESLTEPEPEWRKAKTETFPAITPTQTLQETLREAQEAVAKAEAEAAAAVAALKVEKQQPQKKQPISHAFETLLTSPAKQQEKQQKQQQEKKQPVAKRWFSGKKRVPQVNHAAPPRYPEPAEAYRQPIEPQPKPYAPPVQKVEEPKPYTPPVQKVEEPKSYIPPVQKVEEPKPYTPPVQKVEEPKPYTPPVQKVEEPKPYTPPVQKAEEPKPYTPPVQEPVQEEVTVSTTSEPVEPTPEQKPKKKKWWQWWKKETPSVPKSAQSEESYMPPVQEEPVQLETSHIPPVQEPAQIEEPPIITEPVEPTPVQKPKKQKKARKKKEKPSKQQFAQPEEPYAPPMQEYPQPEASYAPPVQESAQPEASYAPPVQEYTQPEEAYMPPVQEYMQPEEPYTPPVQEYTQPEEAYMPPVQEYMQPEESPVATESELVKSTPIQKPKKQKKVRQKKEKKPKKQKSIPVEESTPVPVTNNMPNSEPEFAAGYAPAEQPLETNWTTEESSHSGWWDDSESKIPGSSGFDPTEEPAPQPEENESYTARFKKVVVQESTYTEPEQPKKPRKPKKEKTPRVKVQKPVPPEPKSIPNQEVEIRVNINLLRNAVFFRTVSLAVLNIIGAFLAIGESSYTLLYPALSQLMTVRGYCFLHLILGLLILFITFPTVINGMRKLFHREADSDTIAAMPLIPCLLTVLATIFVPEPMQHNLVHIFLPVSSFILLMNSIGKLFIIRRATRNFALLTKNFEKYIVTCVQSETAAEELTRGVVQDYPILATIRKTKQMSDFLRHTYASDLADRFSKKLAPIVAGISLLLAAAITGIRIGVLETPAENIPFFCSVLTMLLTAGCSAGIPLTVNLPLDRASKRLCPHGCTLLGYQSVDDFYDVNSILVPAATLFPKQSITISGIKNFSGFQVEEALLDAASMVYAADSILQNAFAALVEEKDGGMLYQVEDCSYEDNLGICGWIRHRRVLLGNREMMMAHHVEGMPTKVRELEMTSGSQDVLYLSVSGVVAGMFVIDITADPMVKRQMQRLKEEQISVIVKSVDSCITLQRLTTLFGVPDSMLKILPSADNDLYEKETAPLQDVSASTIHDGSFFGTARLLLEARSIKRAATTGLLLQVIAVILGLSICIGYILVNGYDNITSQTLLFFQLVMTGLTLLTTRLK